MEPPESLFETGAVVVTPEAIEALTGAGVDSFSLVQRHAGVDRDERSAADRRENLLGVVYELRVSSVYTLPTGKRIRVVTEAGQGYHDRPALGGTPNGRMTKSFSRDRLLLLLGLIPCPSGPSAGCRG